MPVAMEHHALKNVNSCWNTQITFYLKTFGGENSILYLNVVHVATIKGSEIIRHLILCKICVFHLRREVSEREEVDITDI